MIYLYALIILSIILFIGIIVGLFLSLKKKKKPQQTTIQPQNIINNQKLFSNNLKGQDNTPNINSMLKNYLYSILCPEYNVSDSNHQCMIKLISENFSEEEIKALDKVVNTLRGYNQNIFNILYKIANLASKCLSYNWNNITSKILDLDCKLNLIDKNICVREKFQEKYSYMEFKILTFFYSIYMRNISPEVVEFTKLIS